MTLARRLKVARVKEKLSLRDLASVLGMSFSSLARIERGDGLPNEDSLARIERWLTTGRGSSAKGKSVRPWILSIDQRLTRIEKQLGIKVDDDGDDLNCEVSLDDPGRKRV